MTYTGGKAAVSTSAYYASSFAPHLRHPQTLHPSSSKQSDPLTFIPLNSEAIMLHPQPLDWEVVESHAVAPVQVLFKDDGS